MLDIFCLSLALAAGQGAPAAPMPMPPTDAGQAVVGEDLPRRIPAALPSVTVPSAAAPIAGRVPGVVLMQEKSAAPAEPMTPAEPKADTEPKADCEEKKNGEEEKDDRGCFMKMLDGTEIGCCLKQKNISISGWIEASYTCSQADITNMPVVWNDRPNQLILNQWWLRIAQAVDTESKCPSTGFLVDFMFGTDYRYILQRGFWNEQLLNSTGQQNFYGFDMPQAYVNYYDPNWFAGTELRFGKFFTPFGYESIEGPTTPLKSRSYAFNWCPPFTHWGGMAIVNLDKNNQVTGAIVNGNDVMWFDPAEEYRILGKYQWTSDDKKTFWAFGFSLGRGKFNTGEPFAPATIALAFEPAGRNNINVFDFVYSTELSDELTYACEMIYGYQYGVPANVVGGLIDTSKAPGQTGVAHWGSIAKYLLYKFDDQTTGVLRLEAFDDFEGQRTGFEGVYWAATAGIQYRPMDCLIIRPEIRYDYNDYSRPFDAGRRHGLCTATIDMIMKY